MSTVISDFNANQILFGTVPCLLNSVPQLSIRPQCSIEHDPRSRLFDHSSRVLAVILITMHCRCCPRDADHVERAVRRTAPVWRRSVLLQPTNQPAGHRQLVAERRHLLDLQHPLQTGALRARTAVYLRTVTQLGVFCYT